MKALPVILALTGAAVCVLRAHLRLSRVLPLAGLPEEEFNDERILRWS